MASEEDLLKKLDKLLEEKPELKKKIEDSPNLKKSIIEEEAGLSPNAEAELRKRLEELGIEDNLYEDIKKNLWDNFQDELEDSLVGKNPDQRDNLQDLLKQLGYLGNPDLTSHAAPDIYPHPPSSNPEPNPEPNPVPEPKSEKEEKSSKKITPFHTKPDPYGR